jgi:hypothetical protein
MDANTTNKVKRNPSSHVCIPVQDSDIAADIPTAVPVQFEMTFCGEFRNELLTTLREQVVNKSSSQFSQLAGRVFTIERGTIRFKRRKRIE